MVFFSSTFHIRANWDLRKEAWSFVDLLQKPLYLLKRESEENMIQTIANNLIKEKKKEKEKKKQIFNKKCQEDYIQHYKKKDKSHNLVWSWGWGYSCRISWVGRVWWSPSLSRFDLIVFLPKGQLLYQG